MILRLLKSLIYEHNLYFNAMILVLVLPNENGYPLTNLYIKEASMFKPLSVLTQAYVCNKFLYLDW